MSDPSSSGWSRFWGDVRDALRGQQHDLTTGSIGRAITLLAIPMVLEMFMQSVFEVADVFFVGKLGAEAVSVVGLTGSILIIVFTLAIGLSVAATAVVARRIGEKDSEGANRAAVQALILGLIVAAATGVAGYIFAPDLLALMGASPEAVELGTNYCAILLGTNVVIVFLFLINAIFRGAGDAALAMRALWLANLINIILDPIFIFGLGPIPAMGVTGAAIATVIGRGLGVIYQIRLLRNGRSRVQLNFAHLRFDPDVMRRMIRISIPGIIQYFVGSAGWIVIYRLIAEFGSEAIAAWTIGLRIFMFALLPSWGMGNAAATLVGQNLGAQKPDRAERSVWLASFANMVFLGLCGLFLIFFAEHVVRLFTTDAAVLTLGAQCLRILSYTYVLFAFGMVMTQAFNGAGDTRTPTYINLVVHWVAQLPLAYLFSMVWDYGPEGIFWAIAIAQALLAFISIAVFRRGTWKSLQI